MENGRMSINDSMQDYGIDKETITFFKIEGRLNN